MTDVRLTDEQWTKIRACLRQDPNAYVGNEAECRRFVEAVKWMSRSGASGVCCPVNLATEQWLQAFSPLV